MLLAYVGRAGRLRGPSYRKPTPVSVPSPQGEALKPYSILDLLKRYAACLVVTLTLPIVLGLALWAVPEALTSEVVLAVIATSLAVYAVCGIYLVRYYAERIPWWSPIADDRQVTREKCAKIRLWPVAAPAVILRHLFARRF